MWTGDASFLAANYAALKTKTLEKYARSDGLINPPGTGLAQDTPVVDWPYQYRDGYHKPVSTIKIVPADYREK